ncbi:MAG: transcription termination/antitermination protein NusG [Prevotellaceae bacterium]|jgi:transcriptional antiterminator NusG|nr:transcription termination/antitermination protein NusG [Prevotellaceae bacterium]
MSEVTKQWYVLRAAGGREKKAKEYIENEVKRLKLQEHVSQVLIPTEKIYQVKNGKKVSKDRIYFPGYVLVEADLVGEVEHVLRNIPNVSGFLGETKGSKPMALRLSEVNRILGRVDELSEVNNEENATPFVAGEPVKVIDGPFNGFDGIIEEVNEDKKKLKVMVKIFGRKTLLELGFIQVEKE